MRSLRDIDRLRSILAVLRTPGEGCEWDQRQTHASLAPYALEEAYEVVDAIERGDPADLRDELGDYLLQVVFHARIAEEANRFDFGDVVEGISAKLLRRHPHVFPPASVDRPDEAVTPAPSDHLSAGTSGDALGGAVEPAAPRSPIPPSSSNGAPMGEGLRPDWEEIKAAERARRGAPGDRGILAGIPDALPALTRAVKLQTRAAGVGFDWNDTRQVLAKIREEVGEVEQELAPGGHAGDEALRDEIGDLFFAVANLARHLGVDAEGAVRAANRKFERRFAFIESALAARGSSVGQAGLAEMEALWDEAKRAERQVAERDGQQR